jgi:2-amino-4-hydroxy-6-hydroxymethyldihydropteridine diphosphokinase
MMRGFLSLGSNLGEREALLKDAVKSLARGGVTILRSSRIYETIPVEVKDEQGYYLNMVVRIDFEGDPFGLLKVCRSVEDSLGRVRPYPHSPRTMDIDILLLDGITINEEHLVVPHPELERRAFVIHPLSELAPDLVLPSGRAIADVKKELGNDEIVSVWDS